MQDTKVEPQELGEGVDIAALRERALGVAQSIWRPAATSVAVALILLFGWGVVNGKHGLSAWRQQQIQDRQLRQEIQDLQQKNAKRPISLPKAQSRSDQALVRLNFPSGIRL